MTAEATGPHIYKYPIVPGGSHIAPGKAAKPLSAAYVAGEVVVYAEVDEWRYGNVELEFQPDGLRVIALATGQQAPHRAFEYLDTVTSVEGGLVFHIYTMALRKRAT